MNPYQIYQHQKATGWTRIDMLLALYDGAIERLEQAQEALARDDEAAASPLLLRAERIVLELLAGLDLTYGEVPRNLQRLYVHVIRSISSGTARQRAGALEVLRTLREALWEIRPEALALERSGAIPAINSSQSLQAIG
jgi:flagellar secretion chaperone FliS